jgi:hypothetical protein
MIKLNFKHSKKEYVRAARKNLFLSKTIKKSEIVILFIISIYSIFDAYSTSFSSSSVVLLTICILASLTLTTLYFFVPIKNFKSIEKLQEQFYLEFSDEEILVKTSKANSTLKWNIFSKIVSTKEFYYFIQHHPRIYTLIPKRAFTSLEELEEFEKMVIRHLKIKNVD